ncbi:serine protease [Schinkia azotoformans]|uniref:imm11 family protein n=1 Tax=Schinkia azotoformans TaxID=1454 RepID=UPI002E1DC4ED|nr:serine protease [Schinkia azotoformans]
MNYFILRQDERISHAVEPIGLSRVIKQEWLMTKEGIHELDQLDRQFSIKEKNTNEAIDLIEKPIRLISDRLKKLIEKYVPSLPMKSVVLVDKKNGSQLLYWLLITRTLACLSAQTEFHPDGTIKKLVIEEEAAASYPIFKIEGVRENVLIVNVALAEGILRRSFYGIRLQKVATNGKWNELQKRGY